MNVPFQEARSYSLGSIFKTKAFVASLQAILLESAIFVVTLALSVAVADFDESQWSTLQVYKGSKLFN